MRRVFSYFKDMTDDQLRSQPLPPGVKSWDDVIGIASTLNLLPQFVPPPTVVTPAPGKSPTLAPSPLVSTSALPSAIPSLVPVDEGGGVTAFPMQVGKDVVVIRHKATEQKATVTFKAVDAKPEDPGWVFEVDWTDDQASLVDLVLRRYVEEAAKLPSPSPSPSSSVSPSPIR